jgi:hypothetical protein
MTLLILSLFTTDEITIFCLLQKTMRYCEYELFLGAKKRLYKRLRWLFGWSVHPSVRPHNAITWKTSYVAIASRRKGGRGKLVTSLLGDPLVF